MITNQLLLVLLQKIKTMFEIQKKEKLNMSKIFCFDIDGTICTLTEGNIYKNTEPYADAVTEINRLYDEGNTILMMTARGSVSGKDATDLTTNQLKSWGVKYHKLIMNQKPHADFFIDDKAINAIEWREDIKNYSTNKK